MLLTRLEAEGLLTLSEKQQTRPVGSATSIPHTAQGEPGVPLSGRVETVNNRSAKLMMIN